MARLIFAAIALLTLAYPAYACTVCHSDTGTQIRDGVFKFAFNLSVTVLPFVVFGILGTVVYGFGGRSGSQGESIDGNYRQSLNGNSTGWTNES
jgi:hypothetical protein